MFSLIMLFARSMGTAPKSFSGKSAPSPDSPLRFLIRITLFFFFSLTALCTAALSSANAEDRIRYGLSHWPPFALTEQTQPTGIDYDIAMEISRRMAIPFEVRACPFKRCLIEMERGDLDLMSGIARNDERAVYMNYSDTPYHAVSVVFFVRAGEQDRLKKYDDLYNLRTGAVVSSHYFEPFNNDEKIAKAEVAKEQKLLPMLNTGRIDTYVGTDPNASYEILTLGYKDKLVKALYNPGVEVPVYFAFSRVSAFQSKTGELGRIIKEMHQDGTIKTILAKYQ
ncbi:transporter substrate-binding domain-containing protein [Kiloniella laminariae]|uniref:Transporter substrate-binding domain-containing protein n=1 Tax=Kiloniella laminariae TaxID=454162 RepID=A0ABT4LGM5_9PROT|nr:transporter substrate-binding domain-containing protein [Kiloniella laminariae]MCZ4280251.1 transporter substrate-binding domain-containing protein [Kiloniella laminariae]